MGFSWIVSQIGARQHYGVPRGFFYRNELRLLYTDAWCRWGQSLLRRGNKPMRGLAGRWHPDIPNSKVISFTPHAIADEFHAKRHRFSVEEEYREFLRVGKRFASDVTRHLKTLELDPAKDVFFGFNTGCEESFEFLKSKNVITICDQIDPAEVEEQIVFEESLKWPGWQPQPGRIPQEYWQRMHREWELASMVLVNSEWSKQALIRQGVPAEKMFIVPVAYEAEKRRITMRKNMDGPLVVLWIGTVILRKGIQYLIEAARMLGEQSKIEIYVGGPVQISADAVASAPPNMKFLGRITRDQTEDWYSRADVFVLPTLSDGFAITQVEAMAQALPVITTPNCGEVVTDGVDGLIVPARDARALADAIEKLDKDRRLLSEMAYRALDKSTHFYLPRQAQLVEQAVVNYRAGIPLDHLQAKI